jgi:peroxiredoxin
VKDFDLTTVGGDKASLATVVNGKKGTVVVFWSGICSHCVRYDEYLNSFTERHPQLGIIAVASRQGETLTQLRTTAVRRNLTFPIAHDPDGQIAKQWSVRQTPRVFLIDANQLLLYRGAIDNFNFLGDVEYVAYLEPAIMEFMAGKPLSRIEVASFGCAIESVYYNLPRVL